AGGSDPRGVGLDVDLLAERLCDEGGRVSNADLKARADIDHLADHIPRSCYPGESANGVGDEGKIARGMHSAELDAPLAGEKLRDDGRDDGTSRLPRTVGVEGA